MDNYNKIKNFCDDNNCKLLTSFEDFEDMRQNVSKKYYQYVRINFIGSCGHNSSAIVTNFLKRKTGILCKKCVLDNSYKHKNINGNEIEYKGIQILENYLSDYYEIIRTDEGCKADIILKNKNNLSNYIPIQVKSTIKICHNMYSFRCVNKKYNNMLIICVCIDEKKIWVIPYEDITNIEKVNISINSKYNKYLVQDNLLLYDEIVKYYDKYSSEKIEDYLIPISHLHKREQEYRKKREKFISFLNFTYPEIQNSVTDFMINNKKVQEKVCGSIIKGKKQCLIAYLSSHNGKDNKKNRKFRTYCLGENDYYWFHSSIDDRFWIIPENTLYDKGYLANKNEIRKNRVIYLTSEWCKNYQFSYDNIDSDKIKILFD
jgi:hypothetical protein